MYSRVLGVIGTTEDVADAQLAADVVEESLFKTSLNNYQQLNDSAAKYKFVKLIVGELGDQPDKLKWLEGLRQELKGVSVVRLAVAHELTMLAVGKVVGWLKDNVGMGVVVEWETDSGLLGGLVVTYSGRITDLSLKTRLAEYWDKYDGRT